MATTDPVYSSLISELAKYGYAAGDPAGLYSSADILASSALSRFSDTTPRATGTVVAGTATLAIRTDNVEPSQYKSAALALSRYDAFVQSALNITSTLASSSASPTSGAHSVGGVTWSSSSSIPSYNRSNASTSQGVSGGPFDSSASQVAALPVVMVVASLVILF